MIDKSCMTEREMEAAEARELLQAKKEIERRAANEKGRYYVPNGRAEEFIKLLDNASKRDGITIFILRAGNSFGKSCLAANLINYLCDAVPNPYFDAVPYLKNFRRPSKGRLCTTANAARNTYGEEFPKWFSRNQYTAKKGAREFDSVFHFKRTGSGFDIFTFDQDPEAGESITLDWLIVDEPMSHRHFSGLKSRLRFGGIIIFILTPLEGSGWYSDVFETPDRIGRDVYVLEASSEDNCIQHGVRGVIPHAALEDMWADFDEDEIAARRDGKFLHLGGAVYKNYRDDTQGHVLESLPEYYQECWDKKQFTLYMAVDPHDRKPFMLSWTAVFPDNVAITVAEFPDERFRPFSKIKTFTWDVPMYTRMILATEEAIGKPAAVRLIDPNFGPARKAGGDSVLQQFVNAGLKNWRLPPDRIADGHVAVKNLIGDPARGTKPQWYVLAHCKNTRWGFVNYGYKENRDESKGLSETPELKNKDAVDLLRYKAMYGLRYLRPDAAKPLDFYQAKRQGHGAIGAT